jgi:uncharacterized protein
MMMQGIGKRTPTVARVIFITVLLTLLLIVVFPSVFASSGHITLLTVVEGAQEAGGAADLYLDVRPGDGAIFVDSFPLTKLDTQSSIRYANRVACDLLDVDCSQYNFYYTIRANSAIVGGPSAGAAIAVLTAAVLDGQSLDQHTAMTGTINSGGIIGPVAGISAKVGGAKAAGMTKVLIPALTSDEDILPPMEENASDNISIIPTITSGISNKTRLPLPEIVRIGNVTVNDSSATTPDAIDSTALNVLATKGVKVVRVGTLEEALREYTGKDYTRQLPPVVAPAAYDERMHAIADEICDRTALLRSRVKELGVRYNDSNNYSLRVKELPPSHDYSRASLCFSMNIELAKLVAGEKGVEDRIALRAALVTQAIALENATKAHAIATISDLETYAIVEERVLEAQQVLRDLNATDPEPSMLGYAQERLLSAKSWSAFFGLPGKRIPLDQKYLQRACLAKIGEAEERVSYTRLYMPTLMNDVDDALAQARRFSSNEPILCIFAASKAKAQANLVASALAVGNDHVDALLVQKLAAGDASMRKQQAEGIFPIIGYSYIQYASDLRTAQPYSALTFAEYALELSTIDIYFPKDRPFRIPIFFLDGAVIFLLGAIFGFALAVLLLRSWWLKVMKRHQRQTSRRT